MRQLTIVVKPFRAEAVLRVVAELGVTACAVREAKGYGRQKGYLDRYRVLMRRLVREQQYDAAVVAATERDQGIYDEPDFELSFANLGASIRGRIEHIRALPDTAFSGDA